LLRFVKRFRLGGGLAKVEVHDTIFWRYLRYCKFFWGGR
jgi:hypothetical protein